MRSLLIILATAAVLGVPEADSQGERRETNSTQSSAIEGRVLNAVTGEPLRKIDLILRRADVSPNAHSPTTYMTSTDESGRFVLSGIEAGQFRLFASRPGFVPTEFGSRSSAQPGVTFTIDAGHQLRNILLKLSPQALIAGRLTDAEGDPVVNIQVQAMRYSYVQGKKHLSVVGRATTDDRGEYRIAALTAGRYYIGASFPPAVLLDASDSATDIVTDQHYVPTYYPGTADSGLAIPIEVAAGSELPNVNFALSKTHTVRIRGQVSNASSGGISMVTVTLIPTDGTSTPSTSRTFVTNPQGAFDIGGILPGKYKFVASIFEGGTYTTAKKDLDATNDVDGFTVVIGPGANVSGVVRVEGQAQVNVRGVRVSLLPYERGEISTPLPNTLVKEDGTFTLPNVTPDSYRLMAFELPDGYYVKSIGLGDDETLDAGLNLSDGATGPIMIILSPGAGEVSGIVQTAQQRGAIGAPVVLVPWEEKRRVQTQYYRSTTTDQYGRFSLRNVVPGAYKLFAQEDAAYDAFMDQDFIKTIESNGQPIMVRENSKNRVGLMLANTEQFERK